MGGKPRVPAPSLGGSMVPPTEAAEFLDRIGEHLVEISKPGDLVRVKVTVDRFERRKTSQ